MYLWVPPLARLELLTWRQPLPPYRERAGRRWLDFRAPRSSRQRRWGLSIWPVYLIFSSLSPAIKSSSSQQITTPRSPSHLQLFSLWLSRNTQRYNFAACKHEVFTGKDWYLIYDWSGGCQGTLPKSRVSWPQPYWRLEPDNSCGGQSCALDASRNLAGCDN